MDGSAPSSDSSSSSNGKHGNMNGGRLPTQQLKPEALKRTWPSSRHTTNGRAVGYVHDLILNDMLSVLLPTQPAMHLLKFIAVSVFLLVTPVALAFLSNFSGACLSDDTIDLLAPVFGDNHKLVACSVCSVSHEGKGDNNLCSSSHSSSYYYLNENEYLAWIVVISLLSLALWCNYQRRILWMLWNRPVWMDPTKSTQGVGRLPTSAANLRFFRDEQAARAAACCPDAFVHKDFSAPAAAATPNVWNLDGAWQFQLCTTVQEGLELARTKSAEKPWPTIQVPSNWMLQTGVADIPIYTNQKYPIPCEPPLVPHLNPTGVYRRLLPEDIFYTVYQGDQYWLNIHAAESMVFVYVNGYRVGFAKDSRLPSTWNISEYLQPRQNVLTLVVVRWSDGTYLEDQDHWWMAGLHRSVELVRQPAAACIADVCVQQATHKGRLQVRVTMSDPHDKRQTTKFAKKASSIKKSRQESEESTAVNDVVSDENIDNLQNLATCEHGTASLASSPEVENEAIRIRKLRWAVYDDQPQTPTGFVLNWAPTALAEGVVQADMDLSTLTWAARVPDVLLWSAEQPNLYTLTVSLLDENDEIVQVESCRIGFRSISIINGQVCWNGCPLTVCGLNRHEHDPNTGKVISLERMHLDVTTLKRNNFNAVRTSHYPQHPSFYKLCDYYGLYVVDEANLETHGMKPMGRLVQDRQGWEATVIPRIKNLIHRDKNYACIMAWSLGNEAGRGRNLFKARQQVLEMDCTRLVVYESGGLLAEGNGRSELTDVVCSMYPDVPRTVGLATRPDEDRPVILCEYSHAMGNSNGNLHLYWKEFWDPKLPRLQGGFVWDMIDQGLRKVDNLTGREYFAYGGDFGDKINDLQFCINGMFTPDRDPHPAVAEIRHLMQPVVFHPNDSFVDSECVRISVDESQSVARAHFSVQNRYFFSKLEHLDWTWSLTSNRSADPIRRGTFDLSDAKGEKGICVDLESVISRVVLLEKSRPARGNSYLLSLHGFLKKDATWAAAGHVLVTQQFPLKFVFSRPIPRKIPELPPALPVSWRVSEGKVHVVRQDEDGTSSTKLLLLDLKTGGIESIYDTSGENMLETPLLPSFTRAATDNDKGGFEQPLEFIIPGFRFHYIAGFLHSLEDFSYWNRWKLVGVDASTRLAVECSDLRMRHTGSLTQVHARAFCHIKNPVLGKTLFDVQIDYHVWGDGKIRAQYKVDPTPELRPILSLPRVGVHMCLAAPYFNISYYGRGPGENYPDRKKGSDMGYYNTTPQEMCYLKYIVPGENGSRSDCEWIAFRQKETGAGLLVATDISKDANFSCGASLYNATELEMASHTHQLPQRGDGEDPVYVHIDNKLMGLGGDTSWYPTVYPQYRVPSDVSYNFGFWLVPLSSNDDDAAVLSREAFPEKLL